MEPEPSRARLLLVSDWSVDPHAVIAAATARDALEPAAFAVVVPAWLHGLDWVGDPMASVPCACRQLDTIQGLAAAAGLTVYDASVGDPDPVTAVADALERSPASGIILCTRARHAIARPLDVARRMRRIAALPVQRVATSAEPSSGWWRSRERGHCTLEAARAA
jgi:hypothetical protein